MAWSVLGTTPASLLFAYFTIGFCAAFPGLACTYTMIQLDFTASDVATTALLCSVPWCLKPVWAFVSDSLPCLGYRRRPYVCVFSIVASIFIVETPNYATSETTALFVLMLVTSSFALCVVDIAVDGSVMVLVGNESGRDEGKAQTHSWMARIGGGTLAAGWSGYVYETVGFHTLMIGCAALPLVLAIVALDIPDAPVPRRKRSRARTRGKKAATFATLRSIASALWGCRFVLAAGVVVSLIPEINTSMFFFLLSTKVTPREMALIEVTGSMVSLATLAVYNAARPSHRRAFFTGVVLNAVAAAIGSFMANDSVPWLLQGAMLESALSAVGSALILMPTVTELGKAAAKTACEATVYSCALSMLNLASVGSETIAANCMRSLSVTKGNVNNVRIFVGLVAALTLFTAPAAMLFPRRKSSVLVVDLEDDDEDQASSLIDKRAARRQSNAFELSMGSDSSVDGQDEQKETQESKDSQDSQNSLDSAELEGATTNGSGDTADECDAV